MRLESICLELSKHEQVLVQERIEEKVLENRAYYGAIIAEGRVLLQHVQGASTVDKDDDEDERNGSYVDHRLDDERDVERRRIKQS